MRQVEVCKEVKRQGKLPFLPSLVQRQPCINFHMNSFDIFFPYTGNWGWGLSHIWNHTQLCTKCMRNDLEDWRFLFSWTDIILHTLYEVSMSFLWPSHPYPTHVSLKHILQDNPLSIQHYFLSLKKATFSFLFTFSYQSTEASDSKAKQKAHTEGQIISSLERNCVCGLKNWVELQEENDMGFLEVMKRKVGQIFQPLNPVIVPLKLLLSVLGEVCAKPWILNSCSSEIRSLAFEKVWGTLGLHKDIIRESRLLLFPYFKSRLMDPQVILDHFGCQVKFDQKN